MPGYDADRNVSGLPPSGSCHDTQMLRDWRARDAQPGKRYAFKRVPRTEIRFWFHRMKRHGEN
jgi:hypothetical protein